MLTTVPSESDALNPNHSRPLEKLHSTKFTLKAPVDVNIRTS